MRTVLIVLDSAGIGALPDAGAYGDAGSNTLLNIKKVFPELNLKNMARLGLADIDGASALCDIQRAAPPIGCFCKLAEKSCGKDTTVGHWEIAGVITEKPLPTYPNGFPRDLVERFENKIGRKTLGNCTASGTEIIERLGDQHVRTGSVILYTSADSVFQVAAHEGIVPLGELYEICQAARDMLVGEHGVSRVIARPFEGESGRYERTRNRKDFSLQPPRKTMLDYLKEAGRTVAAVGKIEDIFAGQGITDAVHTKNNMDGVDKTLDYMENIKEGLIFTNLVDFDMVYGHRNDYAGYARALMEFDSRLPEITGALRDDDLLIITADHGCDPTTPSTDHSREYIPLLAYGKNFKQGVNLGVRDSFSDIAATVLEYHGIGADICGASFLKDIVLGKL